MTFGVALLEPELPFDPHQKWSGTPRVQMREALEPEAYLNISGEKPPVTGA